MTDRTPERAHAAPQRAQVVAAFAAVYLVWGSTYLAIRFAIETLPPFLMAGVRFLVAGSALYLWARLRGAGRPTRRQWRGAAAVGGLLLLGGNGAVVWAEQRVPSGLTALLVATVPLWMVLAGWAFQHAGRPRAGVLGGVALGLVGLVVLVGPSALMGGGGVDPVGAGVLVLGSLTWAAGSLHARRAPLPSAPLLATAMEMLGGGALLVVAALLTGEGARVHLAAVSTRSLAALGYLIVFGSLVGFTAYIWLLNNVQPALASTYAYVNPVVAVFLGWAAAGEAITVRTLVAAAIIVAAVALITVANGAAKREEGRAEERRTAPGLRGARARRDAVKARD